MRFRKRVKVFPGFHLNFSKSGISSTLGVNGASVNFTKKGSYLNTGVPGTGLYDRKKIGIIQNSNFTNSTENIPQIENNSNSTHIIGGEIKSAETNILTSANLIELKESLVEVYKDRIELNQEIIQTKKEIKSAKTIRIVASIFVVGLFVKAFKNKILDKVEYLCDLNNQLENSFINIDIEFDKSFEEKYTDLLNSYNKLLTTDVIWDITSSIKQDMKTTRSAASSVVTRKPVKFKFDNIDIIKSTYPAFHFENKNGGDLYIYPAFIIFTTSNNKFALIDIKDLELTFSQQRFVEEEKVPSDTKIIDKTWAKVNMNGTPDKRFKGNYEIPIVSYGKLEIKTSFGLNELYSFSNFEKSEQFSKTFAQYQKVL
jgi:hypothetical protein